MTRRSRRRLEQESAGLTVLEICGPSPRRDPEWPEGNREVCLAIK
jgi:hypothetical protein